MKKVLFIFILFTFLLLTPTITSAADQVEGVDFVYGQNLIPYSDMESSEAIKTWPTWSKTATPDLEVLSTKYAVSPTHSLYIYEPISTGIFYALKSPKLNTEYEIEFYYLVRSGRFSQFMGWSNYRTPLDGVAKVGVNTRSKWIKYVHRFKTPSTPGVLNFTFRIYADRTGPAKLYFDDMKLREILPPPPPPPPVPVTPTPEEPKPLTCWLSDVNGNGDDDHLDSTILVGDFNQACRLSPDLWPRADFSVMLWQLKAVADRLHTTVTDYDALCRNNDPDNDGFWTVGPYGPSGADGNYGPYYDDTCPNVYNPNQHLSACANGSNNPETPFVPAFTPVPCTSQTPTDPTPPPSNPTPSPTDPVDPTPPPVTPPLTGFPSLTINDFTGSTVYVSPNGNDTNSGTLTSPLKTVTAALGKSGFDKVLLRAGTYTGGFGVGKSVYLGAYNGESVTISGTGRGIDITADKVLLEGLNVNGFTQVAIGLHGADNIVIRNVNVTMGDNTFIDGIGSYTASNGLLVENTTITGADQGLACGIGPCTYWKIENVKIKNRGIGGDSGSDCFAVESGNNIRLKNVDVTACGADGIDIKGSQVTVTNAVAHNIGRNGIKLWSGGDVINALVYDTGATESIVFAEGGSYRLINSTVAYHSRDGRSYMFGIGYNVPTASIDVQLINSIFYHNTGELVNDFTNGQNRTLKIENCILYDVELTYAKTKAIFEQTGANNRVIDPAFVSPGLNGDFHLKSNSPALSTGKTTEFAFDLNDKARSQGNGWDIGAYEM